LSPRYLEEHCLVPLGDASDGALLTAVGAPLDETVRDELSRVFGRPLRPVEVPAGEIQAALLAARRETPDATPSFTEPDEPIDDLEALASQAPVIKLVNVTLLDALRARASDVHLESTTEGLRVRFRLDGVLHDVQRLPLQYQAAVVSRVKIMAGLNIAERRVPQDGRARIRLAERDIDLRVSTLPALHGESVVLRILDHGGGSRQLIELGMPNEVHERFERLIRRPSGILLVTGPTGSGKTTTLYGALSRINAPGVKIVTVEDPVEYRIEGVTQIPISRKAGLGFAAALRSILRHDPDIIMVGEMRDPETAEIAIQAALTGHLVFSTLHTNDAVSGVTRLVDMGIEPYLVAATVQGILAQRLVRVLCRACARDGAPVGCAECSGTGYRGRTGIFELFTISDRARSLIVSRASLADLRTQALADGMTPLADAGWAAARAGVTSEEEVLRVTSE
jgi:type II secretory ATPase GspE/PulE/Tfp pilus assembly ATPase PilB-like protein